MTQDGKEDKHNELSLLMESLQPSNQNLAIIILRSMLLAQNNKDIVDESCATSL